MAICKTCPKTLSARNKSGYCRQCIPAALAKDPAHREKQRAGIKRGFMANPERLEMYRRNAAAASRSPAACLAREVRWLRDKPWIAGNQAARAPEARAKAAKATRATRLAWCPEHLRPQYLSLIYSKRLKADEARRIILEQHEADMQRFRRQLAAEGYA